MAEKRYLILIEKGDRNDSAYCPDVPGCVATGKTEREVVERMREALRSHLELLVDHGLPIPEPSSRHAYVDV